MDKISLTPPELYGNIGYNNTINERIPISIYLDHSALSSANTGYIANLGDTVNIDRVTDIFLDSFISFDTVPEAVNKAIYILEIKEFDLKTISNNSKYINKIIIPNKAPATVGGETTVHRASKFNYIGTITPTKLKELTIILTLEDGSTGLKRGNSTGSSVWINLILVPREE